MEKDNILIKFIDFMVSIGMSAIIIVVIIQVLGRTPILGKAPHWTEELSRMIFVFIVAFGSIAATLKNEFVAVDLFTSKLRGRAALIYNTVFDFLQTAFFFILIPACLKFVKLGGKQLSPSLRINMRYIYVLILISIVGMGLAKLYLSVAGLIHMKNYKEDGQNE